MRLVKNEEDQGESHLWYLARVVDLAGIITRYLTVLVCLAWLSCLFVLPGCLARLSYQALIQNGRRKHLRVREELGRETFSRENLDGQERLQQTFARGYALIVPYERLVWTPCPACQVRPHGRAGGGTPLSASRRDRPGCPVSATESHGSIPGLPFSRYCPLTACPR